MFSDYKLEVLNYYEMERIAGSLSSDLTYPSPAKIRRQCRVVFETRAAKNDMKIIADFFGQQENDTEYLRVIRSFDVDKFRPVVNFIKGAVKDPDERVIELLAWLIDFRPRPYQFGFSTSEVKLGLTETSPDPLGRSQELSNAEAEVIVGGQNDIANPVGRMEDIRTEKTGQPSIKNFKGAIIALSVAIAVAIGSFIFHKYNPECMYWDGHRYVAVECDVIVAGTDVIRLEETAIQNLKWITNADTISKKHIGKIWYIRNDHMVELFTSGGLYPLDRKRRLFPLSKTIFNNYVATKKVRVHW